MKGQAPIGVLCLETSYDKIPGHIRNPATFGFPVLYQIVRGATPERVVRRADQSLIEPFTDAARALESRGAAAITSGCGFLALFQRQLADAVSVPLYASSLIQLPMVHRMLRADQVTGLLVASEESFTPAHLAGVGAQDVPVRVAGLAGQAEFREVVLDGRRTALDAGRLRAEVLAEAGRLQSGDRELGAVVIECTDLAPFAADVADLLGVPVFDIVTLTRMVHQSLVHRCSRT